MKNECDNLALSVHYDTYFVQQNAKVNVGNLYVGCNDPGLHNGSKCMSITPKVFLLWNSEMIFFLSYDLFFQICIR